LKDKRDFSETISAILGANFFVSHPASRGTNKATTSNTIMCIIGMEKCQPYRICSIGGRTNGTANDVTIINPTNSGNSQATKSATNSAPNPVEIPDNKSTDNASLG
jgi:hypothetical protein